MANVAGAALDVEDEEEIAESDGEVPPSPGKNQHESSSSRQPTSTPSSGAGADGSTAATPGASAPSTVLIDDEGGKRARATVDEEKKTKRRKVAGGESPVTSAPLHTAPALKTVWKQTPLNVKPLATMPPKGVGGGSAAAGASLPTLPQGVKLQFSKLPRYALCRFPF